MFESKIISSLDKCFIDQTPADFQEINKIYLYKNTGGAFQVALYNDEAGDTYIFNHWYTFEFTGDFAPFTKYFSVESVPNYIPVCVTPEGAKKIDPGLVRTEPGHYPDVVTPLSYKDSVCVVKQLIRTLFIEISDEHKFEAGTYPLTVTFKKDGEVVSQNTIDIEVINTCLPEQETKVTQWFYADCLADYYFQDVWSDRHFEICENFIKTAVKNGINMILMPVFTPPLDTAIGHERTTTQLVGVTRENGEYTFDFTLAERWIEICKRCGVKYYEISHLFTQWGAKNAPKIMATVDGEYKKLFGWETDALGDEYVTFLRTFLKEFTAFVESKGIKENVYFHISDEPVSEHLEQYKKNKNNIIDIIKDYKIIDALSHVEFYKEGIVETPVPSSKFIEDFAKEDIEERWVYYCCDPWAKYSNRFMCMHSARTRSIGYQMYKYDIEGFLQWGYNFYNSMHSISPVNPYLNGNAGYWAGGGDAVSVYPGPKGTALESLRIIAFRQGLEDIRAFKLCAEFYGKDAVVAEIEKIIGTITFSNCVDDTATMIKIRETIDLMIKEKVK